MKTTQSSPETIPVVISENHTTNSASGAIQVQFWNKRERTMRALKFGGMCWGAAFVAVFIPLLHFLLVPSLLVAGPIMAWVVSTRESVVLGGQGTCPSCKKTLPIARSAYRFPISDLCTACQTSLKIEKAAS